MKGTIVSSSGAEQWHGIFDYLGEDEEGKECLYITWFTTKVIGYEVIDELHDIDPKSKPTERYGVSPIILNRPEPFESFYETYYIQDSNGLHPSENLGRRTFKTVEEAKEHVLNHFKKKYPKHSVLWDDELDLDDIQAVSIDIQKRKREKNKKPTSP